MDIKNHDTVELKTDRLILAKGTIDDFETVFEYDMMKLRDVDGVFEFIKLEPNEVRNWFKDDIDECYKKYSDKKFMTWIIFLKDGLTPIGNIAADREREDIKACEISYNLHPGYWGNGYMPEAVNAVLDHLFHIGYENVIVGWDEGNKKSRKVSEKVGFEPFNIIKKEQETVYESIMNKEKWKSLKDISLKK